MNGLSGGYSQILINGRPIFSPLTGLYGLEQIPTNMIDRIEVVRGGGSALYGSSAIGGTVNVITNIPKKTIIVLAILIKISKVLLTILFQEMQPLLMKKKMQEFRFLSIIEIVKFMTIMVIIFQNFQNLKTTLLVQTCFFYLRIIKK
ncbi:TonB-dependent receptor plug domain-containing protein [Tenacibaculum maritimum]|nr:TonB-dependent receptor plug domain-containing protein [Tenacibaculum maritimum]